jgi:hypothetical protein
VPVVITILVLGEIMKQRQKNPESTGASVAAESGASPQEAARRWAGSKIGNAALLEFIQSDRAIRQDVVDDALRSPARPLPNLELWEQRFGEPLGHVRLHADAPSAAAAVQAEAFVCGSDIILADASPTEDVLAHELTHVLQGTGQGTQLEAGPSPAEAEADRVGAAVLKGEAVQPGVTADANTLHRYAAPTDWLDYVGLGIDVVERVYIEVAYEEGEEKDYQRAVNSLFFAIDIILAAMPGAGGGGVVMRSSHTLAVAGWGAIPDTAKIEIIQKLAELMKWDTRRAAQFVHRYFSVASKSGGSGGQTPSSGGGTSKHEPLRGEEATKAASNLGYDQRIPAQKAPFNSHGQPVFSNGKKYITPDVDGHNGGVWKMFDRSGKRLGTFDANLNQVGK